MIRYRFKTKSVEDCRPLRDMADIKMPWWCTGFGDGYAVIVCYLPEWVSLKYYWDDAYDISQEHSNEITYTSRFPKPAWLKEEEKNGAVSKQIWDPGQ